MVTLQEQVGPYALRSYTDELLISTFRKLQIQEDPTTLLTPYFQRVLMPWTSPRYYAYNYVSRPLVRFLQLALTSRRNFTERRSRFRDELLGKGRRQILRGSRRHRHLDFNKFIIALGETDNYTIEKRYDNRPNDKPVLCRVNRIESQTPFCTPWPVDRQTIISSFHR